MSDWPLNQDIEEARAKKWRKAVFAKGDSWRLKEQPNAELKPPLGKPFDPERFDIVPAGWDHEHCSICWEEISDLPGHQPNGYIDEDGYNWLCFECFRTYIEESRAQ